MDSLTAFAMGQANRDKEPMVFDWHKAARLLKESGASYAEAGLAGDWEWTGGKILEDGKPVSKDDTYTYLSSTWATPQLEYGFDCVDCYIMMKDSPGWDSDTFWPDSAVAIFEGRDQ